MSLDHLDLLYSYSETSVPDAQIHMFRWTLGRLRVKE